MVPIDEILNLIKQEKVSPQAKKRQKSVWLGKEPDYLPLLLTGGQIPEREKFPSYNLKEQFFDKEKMLYEQCWAALSTMRAKGDSLPSVRVNFGTGFLASVFGLEQEIFEDKMPWLKNHLSKEQIINLKTDDLEPISEKGLLPKCAEYIRYYQKKLKGTSVHIFLPDTQGPFDLAHLVRGDEIFTDIYDDPEFFHHLMELTTYVYVESSKYLKKIIGEQLNSGHHGNCLYMEKCGVRSCEDSTTLLSQKSVKELIVPYIQKALASFENGWLHFCGKGQHLIDTFLEIPEVKGINFGNPENYNPVEILTKLEEKNKIYFGSFPMEKGEEIKDYFTRILNCLKRKGTLILAFGVPEGEDLFSVFSLWHSIQDNQGFHNP